MYLEYFRLPPGTTRFHEGDQDAFAAESAEILVLSREDFEVMCNDHPDIAPKVALMIAEAVSQLLPKTTGALVDHLGPIEHSPV